MNQMMSTDSIHTSAGIISEIQSGIEAIEGDAALFEKMNFTSRADAIDFIDFHIIDRIEGLYQYNDRGKKTDAFRERAEKLKSELEIIDADLFKQIREKIRAGVYATSSFKMMICNYLGSCFDETGQSETGYDHLDIFINGMLSDRAIPDPTRKLEAGMVFYQKTPARIIFELTRLAELSRDDVFYDIGSGLGQAAILVNLLSGCTARGIEYEPAFCEFARTSAAELNLSNVEFINTNALHGDYTEGTVFFLYTPFEGSMLQNLLDILQNESRKRPISIFTYGPCSYFVARQHWLHCEHGQEDNPDILCMFKTLS